MIVPVFVFSGCRGSWANHRLNIRGRGGSRSVHGPSCRRGGGNDGLLQRTGACSRAEVKVRALECMPAFRFSRPNEVHVAADNVASSALWKA